MKSDDKIELRNCLRINEIRVGGSIRKDKYSRQVHFSNRSCVKMHPNYLNDQMYLIVFFEKK